MTTDSRRGWAHSRTSILGFAATLVLLLAWDGLGAGRAGAQGTERVEGVFGAVHADPEDERLPGIFQAFVSAERQPSRGARIEISEQLAARYGGIEGLIGKRVAVTGVRETSRDGGRGQQLRVVALDVLGSAAKGVSLDLAGFPQGKATPALTIMCRFADKPEEPVDQNYFQGLADAGSVLDSYWQNVSYQQINLGGSKVVPAAGPWLVLPDNESDYIRNDGDGTGITLQIGKKEMRLGKLYEDCSALAAKQVNLDHFAVINLAFNTSFINYAFGGGLDGRRLTWLGQSPGWRSAGTTAHEMGHAFHMTHLGFKGDYDSPWDVLSGSNKACAAHTVYACIPQHPSAYNKDRAGWLESRKVIAPPSATTTVKLQPLSNPGAGPVVAKVSPDQYHSYYVEFRTAAGYDANLPLDGALGAVLIHERWEIGEDFVGDSLTGADAKTGARRLAGSVFGRWLETTPREPYFWEYDGVLIKVDAIEATSATVTITHLPRPGMFPKKGAQSPTSYTVAWEDQTVAETRYELLVTETPGDPDSWKTVSLPANATSHTFTNVPSDKQFAHAVRACNALGCGPQTLNLTYGTTPKQIVNP